MLMLYHRLRKKSTTTIALADDLVIDLFGKPDIIKMLMPPVIPLATGFKFTGTKGEVIGGFH